MSPSNLGEYTAKVLDKNYSFNEILHTQHTYIQTSTYNWFQIKWLNSMETFIKVKKKYY